MFTKQYFLKILKILEVCGINLKAYLAYHIQQSNTILLNDPNQDLLFNTRVITFAKFFR